MPDCALAPSIGSPISALPAASRAAQRPTPDLAALERVLAEARQQRAGHVAGLLSGGGRTAVAERSPPWCLAHRAVVLLVVALFAGYDAALGIWGLQRPFGADLIILVAATISSIAGFAFSPLVGGITGGCPAFLVHL